MTSQHQPETAMADVHPCALYRQHRPTVVMTDGHHRHPVFLQNEVYGRIRDPELLWVCSNCHDSIHAWLYHLLGQRKQPTVMPRRARQEAERAYAWYMQAGAGAP